MSGTRLLQEPRIQVIVATLPDPVHTHFSLLFDRLTEALQQAAQDQGYNYDGSWLPWSDETRQYGSLRDQQTADALHELQEQQPGVLVFRKALPPSSAWTPDKTSDVKETACKTSITDKARDADETARFFPEPYSDGLIIFVVGENPTGGIDQEQFQNAVQWMAAFGPNSTKPRLRILGPYFSGSFPSLAKALRSNHFVDADHTAVTPLCTPEDSTGPGQRPLEKSSGKSKKDQELSATPAGAQKTGTASAKPANDTKSIAIFSGTTSSRMGIDWFNKFLEKSPARFYSFQENDDVMIDRYCQYLRKLGYDTGKLAIISEDETAYGYGIFPSSLPGQQAGASGTESSAQPGDGGSNAGLPNCDWPPPEDSKEVHGPLYLYYPRDIASLRSAYEQRSSGSGESPQNQSSSSGTGLPIDLAEPSNRQRDTIRNYGGKQTPLSQESTLFGITNLLKAHDIEFIVLRSSNTLDQVFLTRFLAQAYPSARVVLTSADLLFRRSDETAGFRGTMTLTTYPLLTWQQDWTHWQTPGSRHSHRAFPEDFAEGFYLATRFLIDVSDDDLSADDTTDPPSHGLRIKNSWVVIQDYAPPSWLLPEEPEPTRPPTWLSVVGNGQLWPVAVLDPRTLVSETNQQRHPLVPCISPCGKPPTGRAVLSQGTLPYAFTNAKFQEPELLGLHLPLSSFVCCLVVTAWFSWHFFCCWFGSHYSAIEFRGRSLSPSSFRSLAYFAPALRPQHKLLIFIGSTIMALLAIVLTAMTGVLQASAYPLQHRWWFALYCGLLFLMSWAALVSNYRIGRPLERTANEQSAATCESLKPSLDWRLMCKGGGLLGLIALILAWIFYCHLGAHLSKANDVFVYWRSINLFTGVSPLVPLVLLTAGLYGWFWYSLRGLALFNAGRPKLPKDCDLPKTMPMVGRDKAGRSIERSAIPLNMDYTIRFLFFLVPCWIAWRFSGEAKVVRSLGSKAYGDLYFVWLGLLVVLTLTEAWQLLRIWGRLRQLLVALDELPLRRTLHALKGFSWGTVWKMGGNTLEQRERLLSRQLETLQHFQNELNLFCDARCTTVAEAFDKEGDGTIVRKEAKPLGAQIEVCVDKGAKFEVWLAERYSFCAGASGRSSPWNLAPMREFQLELAATAGVVLERILRPAWMKETDSQILDFSRPPNHAGGGLGETSEIKHPAQLLEPHVRVAEEFFCLPYLGFIQNVIGRLRTMTLSIAWLFIAATLSVATYPFDPRPVLSGIFLVLFLFVATITIFVYAEMHRDATLSHITNTNPGELGVDFWLKLVSFGVGPLLGLLTALFPEITSFVSSWLQPAVGAVK